LFDVLLYSIATVVPIFIFSSKTTIFGGFSRKVSVIAAIVQLFVHFGRYSLHQNRTLW
jgi:hypothetical protein